MKEERTEMIKLLDSLKPKIKETKVTNSGFESNNTFDYFESLESPVESLESSVESVKTDSSLSEELLETASSEEELFEVKKLSKFILNTLNN